MFSKSRAREETGVYFCEATVSSPFPAPCAHTHSFYLPSIPDWSKLHFYLNPLHLAPTLSPEFEATSLAIPLFLLALIGLRQLATLKQLKKQGRRPLVGGSPL
jgi:hypothetical protein